MLPPKRLDSRGRGKPITAIGRQIEQAHHLLLGKVRFSSMAAKHPPRAWIDAMTREPAMANADGVSQGPVGMLQNRHTQVAVVADVANAAITA